MPATESIENNREHGRNAPLTALLQFLFGLLLCVSPMGLWGQITTGGVAGTVKDPSGAVVQGATVSLTNVATQVTQTTQSTSSGAYIFANVPPGTYTLKADAPGFQTYVQTGLLVHVQNVATADILMTLGSVSQQVTVTSAAPLLQAQDASLGQTIPSVQVNDLPLQARNWLSLTQLAAGTYAAPGSNPDNPSSILSNGAEQGQVDFRLNGIDDTSEVFGGTSVAPVPDAIQEFKLQQGNNSAEFGQFAGSVINAVIKSGTNQYHGDLWEYLRNEALNANDYFFNQHGAARPKYRQNQFGGTIGGPLSIPKIYNGKDRTFFFFDYQHTGITQAAQFTDTVPTNLMRSSNFTNLQDLITGNSGSNTDGLGRKFSNGTVLDPATTRSVAPGALDPVSGFSNTTSSTVYVRDPFYTGGSIAGIQDFTSRTSQLNILPAGRIDPNAVKLLQLLPAPTAPGLINNYFVTPPFTSTTGQYDLRIDENISAKDILWGTFDRSVLNASAYQPFPGVAGGALQLTPNDNEPHYEIALNYTHLFSPNLENNISGGHDHVGHFTTLPTSDTLGLPPQFGIQGIPQIPGNGGLPTIDYSGFTSFGGRRFQPTLQTDTATPLFDNLMWTRGSHELHAGFEFNHIRGNIIQPSYSRGDFGFNGQYSSIPNKNNNLTGIADFLLAPVAATVPNGISNLGGLSSYIGSNYAGTDYFTNYYAAYVQDNWRPVSTLTLNLGLRWEYFSPYAESSGRQANFIATDGNGNSGTYYIPQKGCNVPRSDAFNTLLASYNINVDCISGLDVNKAQKGNFAPRLGFAYRILPRVVLRAGYGIAYGSFDSVGYGGTLGTNYPFQFQISNPSTTSQTPNLLPNGQVATLENTFGTINLQDPTQVSGKGLSLYGKQYNYKTPFEQSINVTVQDQFTNHDSIQVGYVAALGRNLDAFGTHNSPAVVLPPGVSQTPYIPFPSLAPSAQFLQTIARSNYHSMQAIYQHQFKNNLILLANYTYGKCMSNDIGKANLTTGSFRGEWLPGFGIDRDYAPCVSDSTHVVHISGEYALPFGRDRQFFSHSNRFVDALISGWNVNYIFSAQSGQPFTVGCPVATTSDLGCNANLISGQDPYAGPHNITQWLNPAAFAEPPVATQIGQTDYSPLGSPAGQVRGPGFYNLDSSLFKDFSTGKNTRLQFRIETFNTLNHPQFNNPSQLNFTNSKNFSNITSTRNNPRYGQLALKFFF